MPKKSPYSEGDLGGAACDQIARYHHDPLAGVRLEAQSSVAKEHELRTRMLPHSMAMKNTVRTCANGILRALAPTEAFMPLVGTRDTLQAEGTRFALRRLAVHDAVDAVGCR